MPLRVAFTLSDADLRHFRDRMKAARAITGEMGEESVIRAAEGLLEEVSGTSIPDFIASRFEKLELLIDILRVRRVVRIGRVERLISIVFIFGTAAIALVINFRCHVRFRGEFIRGGHIRRPVLVTAVLHFLRVCGMALRVREPPCGAVLGEYGLSALG